MTWCTRKSKSETKRYVVTWDDAMYLNPAYEDVRTYIADGVAEIAARYHISENAVSMRLNRTRAKLRTYLAKEGIHV